MRSAIKKAIVTAGASSLLVVATFQAVTAGASSQTRTLQSHTFGVSTYVAYYCQSPFTWSQLAKNQATGVRNLGANSIGLVFPLYTDSKTSNNIYAKSKCGTSFVSSPASYLAVIATEAHARGLKVFLRPSLDEGVLKQQNFSDWRGRIAPSNPALWFSNYLATLTPYLQMAQSNHVESFAISTELSSMAKNSNWPSFITKVKKIYTGELVFTASWAITGNVTHWSGTSLGIDTYRPVLTATNAWSPKQLLGGWDSVLSSLPISGIAQTTMDEMGISSQSDAYQIPAATYFPLSIYPYNPTIQTNWFTMGCAFMREHAMPGIYFSGLVFTDNMGQLLTANNPSQSGNIQPNSQIAIQNCFGKGLAPLAVKLSQQSGHASGGASMTITGSHFIGTFDVTFGGISAKSFVVNSPTSITVVVPKHAKGTVSVQVISEAGKSVNSNSSKFTFN
jgi:hypothetical protein